VVIVAKEAEHAGNTIRADMQSAAGCIAGGALGVVFEDLGIQGVNHRTV
jgi:hypothetical protein